MTDAAKPWIDRVATRPDGELKWWAGYVVGLFYAGVALAILIWLPTLGAKGWPNVSPNLFLWAAYILAGLIGLGALYYLWWPLCACAVVYALFEARAKYGDDAVATGLFVAFWLGCVAWSLMKEQQAALTLAQRNAERLSAIEMRLADIEGAERQRRWELAQRSD